MAGLIKDVPFNNFQKQWYATINAPGADDDERGYRYAAMVLIHKLGKESEDIAADEKDGFLIKCKGSLPGGINAVYIDRHLDDNDKQVADWYLVITPFSVAYKNQDNFIEEMGMLYEALSTFDKMVDFSISPEVLDRVRRAMPHPLTSLTVLIASDEEYLNENKKQNDNFIKNIESAESIFVNLKQDFSIERCSIRGVYESIGTMISLNLPIKMKAIASNPALLIGAISIYDLYEFLSTHEQKTQNINLIYDYNIRQYLKTTSPVNKGIRDTLQDEPERFGLYNNGITLSVKSITKTGPDSFTVESPYIVNGCQTTKTIWDFCLNKFKKETDKNEIEKYKKKIKDDYFVIKITVSGGGEDGEKLQNLITKYTNTQNPVQATDFIALEENFRTWKDEMAKKHFKFLEIQRGSFEAYKIYQANNIHQAQQFKNEDRMTAWEMLRVYAAGWLKAPGPAYNSKKDSLPGGTFYNKMMKRAASEPPFGVDDIYAAYLLHQNATDKGFAKYNAFLYYAVYTELLRKVFKEIYKADVSASEMTNLLISVIADEKDKQLKHDLETATADLVTNYLQDDINFKYSIAHESKFQSAGIEVHYYFKFVNFSDTSDAATVKERSGVLLKYIDHVFKTDLVGKISNYSV